MQKCSCYEKWEFSGRDGIGPHERCRTIFTTETSCQKACCKTADTDKYRCTGTSVSPTADEGSTFALCQAIPPGPERDKCEKSIADLMNNVWTTGSGVLSPITVAIGSEGYCIPYIENFSNRYEGKWDDDSTMKLPGGCTVELLEVRPYEHKKDPKYGFVVTWRGRCSIRKWGYEEHAIGRVCCGEGENRKCMYFDVGSESYTGQFGYDDNWFPPNDANFLDEIDPNTERPFTLDSH